MAESLRGAADRLYPARVSESRPRPWRTAPTPHPGSLLRVLPPGAYSPLARQGCAPRPANSKAGTRQSHLDSGSRWPPPSLRPTGRLIQPSRFATFSPALPSGCSPPHPQTDGAHRGRRGLDRLVDGPLEPRDPLPRVVDLGQVVHARGLLRGLLELQGSDPASIALGPRLCPRRGAAPMAEEELLEAMPGPELVFLGGLARADQVAQRLVSRIRDPHRREIPTA